MAFANFAKYVECQGKTCTGLRAARGDGCSRCSRWAFDCGRCETEKLQQMESHHEDKHVGHMDEVQLVEASGDIPQHLQGGADLEAGLDQVGPGIARGTFSESDWERESRQYPTRPLRKSRAKQNLRTLIRKCNDGASAHRARN